MQSDEESDTEDEKEDEEDEEDDEEEYNGENEEDYGREEEEGVDVMVVEGDPNEIDGGYGVFEEEDPVEMMRKKEKRELRKQMKKKKKKTVPKKSSKEQAAATTGKYTNSVRVNDIPVDGILNNPNMSGNDTYNNSPGSYAASFNPYAQIAAGDSIRERQRNGDERVEIPNGSEY